MPEHRPSLFRLEHAFPEVHVAHEGGHEAVGRPAVDRVGAVQLPALALLHDRDPIGKGQRLLLVVGDVDGRDAQLGLQLPDLVPGFFPQLGVQVGQRLVEQQQVGFDDHGPGEGHPLLLTTGQLRHGTLFQTGQSHQVERSRDAVRSLGRRHLPGAQAEGHVLEDGHVGEKGVVLKHHPGVPPVGGHVGDVLVVKEHGTGSGKDKPGDHAENGRLAASARPEQTEELAVGHGQADALHDRVVIEMLGEAIEGDLGHGRRSEWGGDW